MPNQDRQIRSGRGARGGPGRGGFSRDRRPGGDFRRQGQRWRDERGGERGGERPLRRFDREGGRPQRFAEGDRRERTRDDERPRRRDDGEGRQRFDRGGPSGEHPQRRFDRDHPPRRSGGGEASRRADRNSGGYRGRDRFDLRGRRPRFERDAEAAPQGWQPADQPGDTSWEKVADWYEEHLRNADTHHTQTLAPGVTQLLADTKPGRLLDIGCGPGLLSRHFAELGWSVTGLDVSPSMIANASAVGSTAIKYVVGNAETLEELGSDRDFDAAISVLALQNIAHADRAFVAVARRLKPGGVLVGVILHPAFRFPRQSAWGWDDENGVLFRRVDRYLSKDAVHIVMHPGADPGKKTTTLHRPISWYVNALADAGFLVDRMEEWTSARQSTSGRRKAAENRARQEIPLFLAFRAVKHSRK